MVHIEVGLNFLGFRALRVKVLRFGAYGIGFRIQGC